MFPPPRPRRLALPTSDRARPGNITRSSAARARVTVSNFHSFCHGVLTESAVDAGLPTRPDVLDGIGQVLLLRDIRPDLPLTYFAGGSNPEALPQALAAVVLWISASTSREDDQGPSDVTLKNPFSIGPALKFAAFFVVIFPGNIAQYVEGTDAFGLDSDGARAARLAFQPVLVAAAPWSTGAWSSWRARQ